MAREIPEAVRAVAGLAATVLDEARKLPDNLPGLPIRVLGFAMQLSMRLQQHYAGLVARGDELFTGIHGEDEPGLATFDDEGEEPAQAAAPGFRDSAFDRAAETIAVTDEDLDFADAETSDAMAAVGLSVEIEATAEVLEEFAIDEMVEDRGVTEDADAVENALLESDRTTLEEGAGQATEVDVVSPDGEVATAEAAVTDEGIAAPEAAPEAPAVVDTAGDAEASARAAAAAPLVVHAGEIAVDDALGSGDGSGNGSGAGPRGAAGQSLAAPATAPVEGYDAFSIAQLRGRLRGYAAPTVQQLLEYEEATRAREPYLRMLRNRLEKLATP